ncbi:MAG: CHAP domain-containing protein [Mycobacteriaceae bacterium]
MKTFHLQLSKRLYVAAGAALVAIAVLGFLQWSPWKSDDAITGQLLHDFPDLKTGNLTPEQEKLVKVLRQEFSQPQESTIYSEDNQEPWCADFVSWTMHKAGLALTNPHSGSWRIPGVYTLQEYYESSGKFYPTSSQYQPATGDVVLYGPNSNFGQHTNIVLTNNAGELVTIGGNENNEIRLHKFKLAQEPGVVGFGLIGSRQ